MTDGMSNVDPTIMKLAEQYQSTLVRSRDLNDERKVIRENVEKLGVDPQAFQVGLRMARDMTKGERQDYSTSLNRVLGVLDGKEADLFGADEIKKRDERAQKRADEKAAAGRSDDELDAASDENPRSDPAKGGAGRKPRKPKATHDNVVELNRAPLATDQTQAEQAEGDAVLSGHIETMRAEADKPVSQTAQAQEIRDKLGLDR